MPALPAALEQAQMTADLAQRLRDEADVWERSDPIYGTTAGLRALLREAADTIETGAWAEQLMRDQLQAQALRVRDLTERLDAVELAFTTTGDQADALSDRLAAAERVIALLKEWDSLEAQARSGDASAVMDQVWVEVATYEKAYLGKHDE